MRARTGDLCATACTLFAKIRLIRNGMEDNVWQNATGDGGDRMTAAATAAVAVVQK